MSANRLLAIALAAALLPAGLPAQGRAPVVINGHTLSQAEEGELLQRHGLPSRAQIPGGRYWYDRDSGLWGMEGGPTIGQILPGLNVGGPLRADASGGGTGIFINGRELHQLEVAYLQSIFGYVIRGRYWLNPQGIGGYEGGPPAFNLYAAARQATRMGGGYDGYTRRTPFGSMGSDGNCSYFMTPDGSSVMTGNC
jgi:hypothetical protein